jgi:TRAP transporter TAXI family solute receptor
MSHLCRAWRVLLAATLAALAVEAAAQVDYKIVTGSERGTYMQIGRDLAKIVAPPAGIRLEALPSAGSAENVRRLRFEAGVKLALVQSDVYQAFLDQAASGNPDAAALIKPLRLVMPLYNEEIYFLARADSPLNYVHDIRNARINLGPIGSGTALSAATMYRLMFGAAVPESRSSFMANEEALTKLIGDNPPVDVVVVVAGQPAKLLADMTPEARQHVKLLKVDVSHPSAKAALRTYFPATVRASSYPNLLAEDIPAFAVKAFLVTYDYNMQQTAGALARFARSLCENFPRLQAEGHPKWKEVELALPDLGRGWTYYAPTSSEIRACLASRSTPGAAGGGCSQQQRILGLCR